MLWPVVATVEIAEGSRVLNTHRTTTGTALPVAAAAAVALALGGCAAVTDSDGQTGTSSTGDTGQPGPRTPPSEKAQAAGEDPDRQRAAVEAATTAAAQYDYAAALGELEGFAGAEVSDLEQKITAEQSAAVRWEDNSAIPHIFFHSLIVDPKRAFAPGPDAAGYADYMVTVKEFTAMLPALYDRGYVLVDPRDVAGKNGAGVMGYRPIELPAGKKPLVLSVDDVNYYEYMNDDGFATNLTLDGDGELTNTYIDASGATTHGSFDVPTIVDDFVEDHPDFSYRGARGVLALTGYNGVLGYRTSDFTYPQDQKIDEKKQQATDVAAALKEQGWVFASHSWGHIDMSRASPDHLQWDTAKWDQEVRPILGDTDLLIYPFGADLGGGQPYSGAKYQLMDQDGFDYYFGIAATPWAQLTEDYLRQQRLIVDGMSMRAELAGQQDVLGRFFDVAEVYDPARPRR